MKQLERMKDHLVSLVDNQLSHVETADTKELGDAIDMIKDLAETMYYCTITEAMKEKKEQPQQYQQQQPQPRYYDYVPMRDVDKRYGRMYYDPAMDYNYPRYYNEPNNSSMDMRDYREGRSSMSRRNYMESKELHHPKEKKMKDLEQYLHELSEDITEMIHDATPEEKQLLQNKISTLATKIV